MGFNHFKSRFKLGPERNKVNAEVYAHQLQLVQDKI